MGMGMGSAFARLLCVVWAFHAASAGLMTRFRKAHPPSADESAEQYDFDWIAYLDQNPHIARAAMDKDSAWHHFSSSPISSRSSPHRFPKARSLQRTDGKVRIFLEQIRQKKVPIKSRTLVFYYLPSVSSSSSFEVLSNTLKIFLTAIVLDPAEKSSNFYWFNAMDGDTNPLVNLIPDLPHVTVLKWNSPMEQNLNQARTLDLVHGAGLTAHFGSIFFGDAHSRGPLARYTSGQWLADYRHLVNRNNVGLVGATFSCEVVQHVQNHSWAIHRSAVPVVLSAYATDAEYGKWKGVVSYNTQFLSLLLAKSHNLSSIMYHNSAHEDVFSRKCLALPAQEASSAFALALSNPHGPSANPLTWCGLRLEDVLFLPWHLAVHQRVLCDSTKRAMAQFLHRFSKAFPSNGLVVPETMHGGALRDLGRQYEVEMFRGQIAQNHSNNFLGSVGAEGELTDPHQLCLLVRSSYVHTQDRNVSLMDQDYFSGFDNFARSMLRQTDGNWVAYFFITDHFPFSARLRQIIAAYGDPRLQFLHIPKQYRPKYTPADAGYTATDVALRRVLQESNCDYISVTNADNIYGTDVVRRVRNVRVGRPGGPSMVLSPLDSRNFIYQDLMGRTAGGLGVGAVCKALATVQEANALGMAVTPRPILGKIDLAGVFFGRAHLAREQVMFSDFSDPAKFPCAGCQDGYLTEYLVQNRHWRYAQLGVDGLQSLVFHGPSPAWCAAAGLVWLGHPHVNKARCFSRDVVAQLQRDDERLDTALQRFDWPVFEARGQTCLQLTKQGLESFSKL